MENYVVRIEPSADYYGQINEERQYWKYKFYAVTEGNDTAKKMLTIDRDSQKERFKHLKRA